MSALFPAFPPERRYSHGQPFTPYNIPTGLKYAEWDFERTPQITTAGGLIASFAEPVTAAAFAQATGADQPALDATGFNGRPCALFDGTDFLQNASDLATLGWPTGGAFEVWALFEDGAVVEDVSNNSWLFNYPTNVINASLIVATVNSVPASGLPRIRRVRARIGTGASSVDIIDQNVDIGSGLHILRIVSTGAEVRLDVDGVAGAPVACVASFSGTARSTIGSSAAVTPSANFFTGNINFLGLYRPLPELYAAGLYEALNRRKEAASQPSAWTPASLGASLLAWWDAERADLMTNDGAGLISSWRDIVGAYNVTAATTARPTYSATSFNGRPGITFDGVANALTMTTPLGWAPIGSAGSEDWYAFDQPLLAADTSFRNLGSWGGGSNNNTRVVNRQVVSAVNRVSMTVGTGAAATSHTNALADFSGRKVVRGVVGPTETFAEVNGVAAAPTAIVPATVASRLRIGASAAAAAALFAQGTLNARLITGPLTTQQASDLRAWLTARTT